uniref:RING-type domain-containing protein n=1 Tax=Oryza punctata TaxID=4537 RepID=A0A0E0KEB0_ORYPU
MSLTNAPSSMVSIVSPVSDRGRMVAGVPPVLVGASVSSAPELRGRAYLVHHVFYEDGSAIASASVDGSGGVAPASKESVAALREVEEEGGDAGEVSECAICLDGESHGGGGRRRRKEMPCGHRFHGECVERWLGIHGSCPLCRHEMPPATATATAAEAEDVVVAMVHGERVVMRGRRVVLSVLVMGRAHDDGEGPEQRDAPPIPLPRVLIDDLD